VDVVTGAFSYTGRWIAERLLASGREVWTLSRKPGPEGSPIRTAPLQFADEDALARALEGADTLYNTYWIRLERGASTFARAVDNTRVLLRAARRADVRRLVQCLLRSRSVLHAPLAGRAAT
jgi:nucleoside-diphosphate-sugar epimerase